MTFDITVKNNLEYQSIFVQIKAKLNEKISFQHQSIPETLLNSNSQPPQIQIDTQYNPNVSDTSTNPNNAFTEYKQYKQELLPGIRPGFVHIPPFQLFVFPVNAVNASQIVFISVYLITCNKNNKKVINYLANQVAINRQFVEITRSEKTNDVIIISDIGPITIANKVLMSWCLPPYLCNAMINNGWNDMSLWHLIQREDLIEMGFKRGHQITFFKQLMDSKNGLTNYNHLLKLNLPSHLCWNLFQNGWTDVDDWKEINDSDFEKMNFKNGHKLKLKKHIKNGNLKKDNDNESSEEHVENKACGSMANAVAPIFQIEQNAITHEQFRYKLNTMKSDENYFIQLKVVDELNAKWEEISQIKNTDVNPICDLKGNTKYSVRIRAVNKNWNKRRNTGCIYSNIQQMKTKDLQWKKQHLPSIPRFNFAIASNNKQITVEFDRDELKNKIRQTKFDERYSLDIGTNGLDIRNGTNWKNVATIRNDKANYKYNLNPASLIQQDTQNVIVSVSSHNDLGRRYTQISDATWQMQVPTNQLIKEINTLKHGTNLQFDETKRVATKISQDSNYSTFSFGAPVTSAFCNRYDIYIYVKKLQSDFLIGYVSNAKDVKNWNQAIGYGKNKNGVGVLAAKNSNEFPVYNRNKQQQYMIHNRNQQQNQKWDDGSVFILSFDFVQDACKLYMFQNEGKHGNKLLKSIPLHHRQTVIPTFSLNYKGDSIEILKWRLY